MTIHILSDINVYESVISMTLRKPNSVAALLSFGEYLQKRNNPRNFLQHQQIIKNICKNFSVPICEIPATNASLNEVLRGNSEALIDYRILGYCFSNLTKSQVRQLDVNIGAVSAMADLYLANAPLKTVFFRPKEFHTVMKWRTGLKRVHFDYWVMPELRFKPKTLASRPISHVSLAKIKETIHALDPSIFPLWVSQLLKHYRHAPIVIISPNSNSIVEDIREDLNSINRITGKTPDFLIKPHPGFLVDKSAIEKFENIFGYPSINSILNMSLHDIPSVPLEVLFVLFQNSLFIGDLTGAIHILSEDRIIRSSFVDKGNEKYHLFQYSQFLKLYSKTK